MMLLRIAPDVESWRLNPAILISTLFVSHKGSSSPSPLLHLVIIIGIQKVVTRNSCGERDSTTGLFSSNVSPVQSLSLPSPGTR